MRMLNVDELVRPFLYGLATGGGSTILSCPIIAAIGSFHGSIGLRAASLIPSASWFYGGDGSFVIR